jgi:TonB family protein
MPKPESAEAARQAHFSGTVTAEVAVRSDGAVRATRIVTGAPFGLNEEAIEAINAWKCKPAMLDGKPVATVVPLETNFRLFGPD